MQSVDSLRELNAKLLAEIAELRKENAKISELKKENAELKDKNAEIPDLKRKFAEIESEKVELKARIAELLRQAVEESKRRDVENAELKARIEEFEKNKTDSSTENVRRDDEIVELKAELVKLRVYMIGMIGDTYLTAHKKLRTGNGNYYLTFSICTITAVYKPFEACATQ
jgi:predicted RNase H-like nuclease (RuvC/YqgF family)